MWHVEGDEAVLDWMASESELTVHDAVLKWIPEFAQDPLAYPAMLVPGLAAPIYVTFVPWTNVGVKFLLGTEGRTVKFLKLETVKDL